MPDFDVQQVREAVESRTRQMGYLMSHRETGAALAVIVPAVTQQVRALHRPVRFIFRWNHGVRMEERCERCRGKAGVWECGCWAEYDTNFYCAECSSVIDPHRVPHPCPTVDLCDALDAVVRGNLS